MAVSKTISVQEMTSFIQSAITNDKITTEYTTKYTTEQKSKCKRVIPKKYSSFLSN